MSRSVFFFMMITRLNNYSYLYIKTSCKFCYTRCFYLFYEDIYGVYSTYKILISYQ